MFRRCAAICAVTVILAGTAACSDEGPQSATGPKTSAVATSSERPVAAERARIPEMIPTPTPAPETAKGATFGFYCRPPGDINAAAETYSTMEEVWATGKELDCEASGPTTQLSQMQQELLTLADYDDPESLKYIYGNCASTVLPTAGWPLGGPQDKEAQAMLMLCPDNPLAATVRETMAAREQQDAEIDQLVAEKRFIYGDRSYLVGTELMPGTYRTVASEVKDCYWEISDSNGNIIENSFVTFSPSVTVSIPSNATGFTTERCGAWKPAD